MVSERRRSEMVRALADGDRVRPTADGDRPGDVAVADLAALMFEAYRGSIDDEGETFDDALAAVEALLAGEFGRVDDEASIVVRDEGRVVAATIVSHPGDRPLVAFSMTHPSAVRRGHARLGLRHAIGVLARAGWSEVWLVVTDANDRAVPLYRSEGFERVTRPGGR